MKYLECVPNFSEGRNADTISAIAAAVQSVRHVQLLHVDVGFDANRTVFTFAGIPEAVGEAAYKAIQVAAERIDMREHKGTHPRIGACDVCPLIPLGDADISDADTVALQLGKKLGDNGIPVFLYEASAKKPERKNLAEIRQGEYEGLAKKLYHSRWKPDFGPVTFQEKFGAVVIGAREFLIAYNINLATTDVAVAKRIAASVRESGYTDQNGLKHPGAMKGLKAIGWWMEAYQCTQVSTNIVNIHTAPIKEVYDQVKKTALALGTQVTGSELIGLIPEQVLLQAGLSINPSEQNKDVLITEAIEYLGLDIIPEERILERRLSAHNFS
jgi:glutamate formiminotransferase / formiminotetrahydrofolate cyclodeaminase